MGSFIFWFATGPSACRLKLACFERFQRRGASSLCTKGQMAQSMRQTNLGLNKVRNIDAAWRTPTETRGGDAI